MVRLECIEEGCSYITQDLPFDQAERILDMHLNRKHPVNNISMAPSLPNLRMPPCLFLNSIEGQDHFHQSLKIKESV